MKNKLESSIMMGYFLEKGKFMYAKCLSKAKNVGHLSLIQKGGRM